MLMGDPPRRHVKRVLRVTIKPGAPVRYLAHYDMNRATDATCGAFLARVTQAMRTFY